MDRPMRMFDADEIFRPLPRTLLAFLERTSPHPPETPPDMRALPDWILTLTYDHSNQTLDREALMEFATSTAEGPQLNYEGWSLLLLPEGRFRVARAQPEPEVPADWMLPKITDYWDQQQNAIAAFSARLRGLDDTAVKAEQDAIEAAVRAQTDVLDEFRLMIAAICVFEDLYKAACMIDTWDEAVEAYLAASAGTFTTVLREREFTVQYLVTHPWEGTGRPFVIFPAWYRAAAIPYCCPQQVLDYRTGIDGIETPEDYEDVAPGGIDGIRGNVNEAVAECHRLGMSFVQLDLDPVETSFQEAMKHRGEAGVLTLQRDGPPTPGSKVSTSFPK